MTPPSIVPVKPTYFLTVVVPVIRLREGLERCLQSVEAAVAGIPGRAVQLIVRSMCRDYNDGTAVRNLVGQTPFELQERFYCPDMYDSWNKCILSAQGEWVHILADDDYVDPFFYHSLLENPGHARIAASGHVEEDELARQKFRNDIWKESGIYPMLDRLECGNPVVPSAVIVQRRVYEQVGGYAAECVLDWEFYLRASRYVEWYISNRPLCHRVDHLNADSRSYAKEGFWTYLLKTIEDHERWIAERDGKPPESVRIRARDNYMRMAMDEAYRTGNVKILYLARQIGGLI